MNKLAYRRAFADAYEYAMGKIAGCCGGKGGMAMIFKHMGEKWKAKRRKRKG